MKYKAGDKVRIKSLDWYNENKDEYGVVLLENGQYLFFESDTVWCGKVITIVDVCLDEYYTIVEDHGKHRWTDDMIEGIVEEETKPIDFTIRATSTKGKVEVIIPDGYGYEIENDKLYFTTKKKEYPKTYEECCKVMGVNHTNDLDICEHCDYKTEITYYEDSLLEKIESLYRLIICRDAYWKIAGEEMGLGKPWKPDWEDESDKFTIEYFYNNINTDTIRNYESHLLVFPTKEMRDAFYENFKEQIEQCKELL